MRNTDKDTTDVKSFEMKKGGVYIDSDSFFWPSDIGDEYMHEQRKDISFEKEQQDILELFEQYYLGFRSSFFICAGDLEREKGLEILKEWCKLCVLMAQDYLVKHVDSDVSLPVDFVWIIKKTIIDIIKDAYPDAKKIPLKLTMKPMISARVKDKNTIVFPALIRSVLNQCNLVLINQAFEIIDKKSIVIDRRRLSRFILPYLLFCHDDFSVSNLPIIGGYSEQAIMTTLSYTNLQVMYIFAHEYAHILLGHFDDGLLSSTFRETKENDADAFALNIVLKYIEFDDRYTKDDVFTAIRWLFKYQSLEESVGMLTHGENLNNFRSGYEKRRSLFQSKMIKEGNITGTSLLDMLGFASIVELQGVLYEYGTSLIDIMIQAFYDSKHKGEIEPWWEIILQK